MNTFFARNFTICDHWFCAVPSGTQPNRLMAMSGSSVVESNATPLPGQRLVYDWLDERHIRWRVYPPGTSLFHLDAAVGTANSYERQFPTVQPAKDGLGIDASW